VGFNQGTMTQLALSGSDALSTMSVLRLLRSGRTTEALHLLEVQLDSQVAESVFGRQSYSSPYNVPTRFVFPDVPRANAWALSQVLEYRQEYPPVNPDQSVNSKLMKGLEGYRNVPRPNTSATPFSSHPQGSGGT
jgi:hypothetical protein